MAENYARLRTKYLEVDKLAPVNPEIHFPETHVIIGIFTPETGSGIEESLNRLNLKPYEQAVRKFASSDFSYDIGQFSQAGRRIIYGMQELADNTHNTNDKCPLIVAYLEFMTVN